MLGRTIRLSESCKREKNSLSHHLARPLPVVLAHLELECGLRHPVCVLVEFLEHDLVDLAWLDIAEEAEVDDEARVDVLGDGTVGECVPVDLRVPGVFGGQGCRDLRLGIAVGCYASGSVTPMTTQSYWNGILMGSCGYLAVCAWTFSAHHLR